MKNSFVFFIFFLFASHLVAQTKTAAPAKVKAKPVTIKLKPIAQNCGQAIPITVKSGIFYGPADSTRGFGNQQEFGSGNPLTFDGEHNSAWYLLSMGRDGQLIFTITPLDSTNDYDFLLYTYTDSTFCDQLKKNKLLPVRSNLSNIKKSVNGVTGLKQNTIGNIVKKGIGNAFSTPIDVKKGEKYMLILDNVTSNGKGHVISFDFIKEITIKGTVIDSDQKPLVADVTLSDIHGNTVEETKSDTAGYYEIKTVLIENQNYSISYIADSTFVQTVVINTANIKNGSQYPNIKTVLPKLKKGEKYKLGNINFYGGVAMILPESYPSIDALYKLMKKNKNMVIQIEGHVNDPVSNRNQHLDALNLFDQALSDERAQTIYEYLKNRGIQKERMTYVGLSNKFPIVKAPENDAQASKNRRVEIRVISIN